MKRRVSISRANQWAILVELNSKVMNHTGIPVPIFAYGAHLEISEEYNENRRYFIES